MRRRSASESITANLGGVGARGAVDQPQRPSGVDAGGGRSSPRSSAATASAFDAPATVKTARRAELMAGSVRVRRGCGLTPLGSSVASTSTPGSASRVGASGNSEAVCPSGPMPKWIRSIPGPGHEVRHGALVGLDALVDRPDRRHGREGPDPAHPLDEGLRDQALVGVDVVGRDDALVPDEDVHDAPVDAGRGRPGPRSTPAPSGRRRAPSAKRGPGAPRRPRAPRR